MFVGMTIMSSVGWWLGEQFGLITGFMLSGVGSIVGVYAGWRLHRMLDS